MKIAFVVQRYGIDINGGAEQHCRQLAEKMSERHIVDVLTTTCTDYYTWDNAFDTGVTELNGVTIRRFSTVCNRDCYPFTQFPDNAISGYGYINDYNWVMQQGPVSFDLINYINYHRNEYDVFIFFTYLYFTTIAGIATVPEKSILIPTAHDEPPIYRPVFRSVFNLARGIFYNTPEEKKFVQKLFKNEYIPHRIGGIGFDNISLGDAEKFRNKYGISDQFILYAGRITEKKGCTELFEFFSKVNPDVKLVLIGKEDINVPKSDKIISLGFVSDEDKLGAINASKAVVIPSKYESFSMILAEAMMLKKPVIVNGKCEVLKGHCRRSCGGVYYTNIFEFAECLKYISDEKNAHKLGENGFRYISDNYTWNIIIDKLESLIKEVRGDI